MNRKSRICIALFLVIIIGTIGYYEMQLKKYNGITYVQTYHLKKNVNLVPGAILDESSWEPVIIDKSKLPANYIKNPEELKNKIAIDKIYGNEILTSIKFIDKKDYLKQDEVIVSLASKSENDFAGNYIRPGDVIDILILDQSTLTYVSKPEYTNIEIINTTDKDGVDYINNPKNKAFIIKNIYFKSTNSNYSKLAEDIEKSQGKYQITVHSYMHKIDNSIIDNKSNGIINIK